MLIDGQQFMDNFLMALGKNKEDLRGKLEIADEDFNCAVQKVVSEMTERDFKVLGSTFEIPSKTVLELIGSKQRTTWLAKAVVEKGFGGTADTIRHGKATKFKHIGVDWDVVIHKYGFDTSLLDSMALFKDEDPLGD